MDITRAAQFFTELESKTGNKREKKTYSCFSKALSSLQKKDLTEAQFNNIKEKLASLDILNPSDNKKKFYRKSLTEFLHFLKKEFSFTTEKHYTELGIVFGMCFGSSIGLSIGMSFDPKFGSSTGISLGIGVGMLLGLMYGSKKDAEAKRLGRVL